MCVAEFPRPALHLHTEPASLLGSLAPSLPLPSPCPCCSRFLQKAIAQDAPSTNDTRCLCCLFLYFINPVVKCPFAIMVFLATH